MYSERGPNLEEIDRQEERNPIVAMMRERGLENEEIRQAITKWALHEEQRIPRDAWGFEEQMKIDFAQADMMAQASHVSEVIEFLKPLLDIAGYEGRGDLILKVADKLQELESKP